MQNDFFSDSLAQYLNDMSILNVALEYARTNAVKYGDNSLGYNKGKSSLFLAFSWSDTNEGYAFWANHHNRYLIMERGKSNA